MTIDEFWQHIEGAKNSCAKLKDAPGCLTRRLSQLPECDIVILAAIFMIALREQTTAAYGLRQSLSGEVVVAMTPLITLLAG